jgi:Resolvase, N terminal domain
MSSRVSKGVKADGVPPPPGPHQDPSPRIHVGPDWARCGDAGWMDGVKIGYVRVSTTDQDLTAQRDALLRLGVANAQIYVGTE